MSVVVYQNAIRSWHLLPRSTRETEQQWSSEMLGEWGEGDKAMNQKHNIPRCQISCEFSRSIYFILFTLCGHWPALNLCVCVCHVQTHTVVLKSHGRGTVGGLRRQRPTSGHIFWTLNHVYCTDRNLEFRCIRNTTGRLQSDTKKQKQNTKYKVSADSKVKVKIFTGYILLLCHCYKVRH